MASLLPDLEVLEEKFGKVEVEWKEAKSRAEKFESTNEEDLKNLMRSIKEQE
jgi:hypothetical protein